MADLTGEVTREFEITSTLLPGWDEILEKYEVELVIMPPDSVLVHALQAGKGWTMLYQDDTAAILQKPR